MNQSLEGHFISEKCLFDLSILFERKKWWLHSWMPAWNYVIQVLLCFSSASLKGKNATFVFIHNWNPICSPGNCCQLRKTCWKIWFYLFNFYSCPSHIRDSGWFKIIKNNIKFNEQNVKQKIKKNHSPPLKSIIKDHIKNAQIYLGAKYNPLFTFSTAIERTIYTFYILYPYQKFIQRV